MATIPLTISGINEAKQQLADLGQQFDKLKDDPIESKRLANEFNTLAKSVHNAEEAFDELNSSGKNLTATFEDVYGEGIQPMTSRIGELEDRLYELSNAGQQNSEEFKTMAAEAARLRQNIIDTDRQVDLLAENRGLSVLSTGFSQVGESLLRLDFEGASRDAKALNAAFSNLGQRGAQAIKGLGSTIGQLGKTFAKMGVALLANPIFLLTVAITAIVAAVVALMNELGFLQPLLDAVGEAFQWFKDLIMAGVQALKDFSDWLGITNFAMKDLAAERIKEAQDAIDKTLEIEEAITSKYDQEIRLARIAGKDTFDLEIEKQESIRKTQSVRQKALELQLKAAKIAGNLDKEEIAKIEDQLKAVKKLIKKTDNEIDAINAQRDADNKKKDQERRKAGQAAYKQRLADQKAFEQERLRVERQTQDLELSLQDEGIKKDLAANALKYQRLIEDVNNNEKLLAEEKTRLTALYEEQEFEKRKEIELNYQAELDKAVKEANQKKKEEEEKERAEALQAQKDFNDALLAADKETRQKQQEEDDARAAAKKHMGETLIASAKDLEAGLAAAGVQTAGLQKTLALVDIATNTAKAISNVIAGATAASAAGGAAAPFLIAGYIASGIATVASGIASAYAALKSAPNIGGSVSGGGATGAVSAASPAQPSFEFFGQNNNANNLSAAEDEELPNNINVTALVSEVELTATQKKSQKLQESATL